MNNQSICNQEILIDLSFKSFPLGKSLGKVDEKSQVCLSSSQIWSDQIESWLNYIAFNNEWNCPDLVRNAKEVALGLEFTDDVKISELNRIWRHKEENTDVLSFPLIDETCFFPCDDYVELGDIVISVPTAKKQALEYEHHLKTELRWLTSHGLLHLLGWDHPDEDSLVKMLKAQEVLLNLKADF